MGTLWFALMLLKMRFGLASAIASTSFFLCTVSPCVAKIKAKGDFTLSYKSSVGNIVAWGWGVLMVTISSQVGRLIQELSFGKKQRINIRFKRLLSTPLFNQSSFLASKTCWI